MIRSLTLMALLTIFIANVTSCSNLKTNSVQREKTAESSKSYSQSPANSIVSRTNSIEKKVLARLVRNLEELMTLVNEAEFRANPDDRIRFDYQQLRSDLISITEGIHGYLRTPNYSPRSLKPIPGNYSQ